MEITSLCLIVSATVSIIPNKSQFFWYESINLTCPVSEHSQVWTLMRNTSKRFFERCDSWGMLHASSCTIEDTYPSDTGVYWCVSDRGECTNTVNVTVSDRGVILKSPASPVTEGDTVSLHCSYRDKINRITSNFTASFYKGESFIGTKPDGKMSFSTVHTSDEGFYKCKHPTKGESLQSWLSVRVKDLPPPTPPPPVMSLPRMICIILLIILYTVLTIVCVTAHQQWKKARLKACRRSL